MLISYLRTYVGKIKKSLYENERMYIRIVKKRSWWYMTLLYVRTVRKFIDIHFVVFSVESVNIRYGSRCDSHTRKFRNLELAQRFN